VAADEEAGTPRKQAISDVAKRFGVPKRTVYDAVLAARDPGKTS
jgi:16S rRNA (cytidine1402-2'-O)-methyltransferase